VERRRFLTGSAAAAAGLLIGRAAFADVPVPFTFDDDPPMDKKADFVAWMQKNRGESPRYLGEKFDRFQQMIEHSDVWEPRVKRAFLMTPREEFVQKWDVDNVYARAFLDIGFGVTISGPNLVGRMTSSLDVQLGEKVLEVGTGSGYQSAVLSHLTNQVFSIEIIKPLAARTRGVYDALIARGYKEFAAITSKNDDGYYGWEANAPFDKIVVTCGIDHIPPPLLQQLKPNGIMVIPVGPPGSQHVLKVVKKQVADGSIQVTRNDIYGGDIVNFVPFTKLQGEAVKGTHDLN